MVHNCVTMRKHKMKHLHIENVPLFTKQSLWYNWDNQYNKKGTDGIHTTPKDIKHEVLKIKNINIVVRCFSAGSCINKTVQT